MAPNLEWSLCPANETGGIIPDNHVSISRNGNLGIARNLRDEVRWEERPYVRIEWCESKRWLRLSPSATRRPGDYKWTQSSDRSKQPRMECKGTLRRLGLLSDDKQYRPAAWLDGALIINFQETNK